MSATRVETGVEAGVGGSFKVVTGALIGTACSASKYVPCSGEQGISYQRSALPMPARREAVGSPAPAPCKVSAVPPAAPPFAFALAPAESSPLLLLVVLPLPLLLILPPLARCFAPLLRQQSRRTPLGSWSMRTNTSPVPVCWKSRSFGAMPVNRSVAVRLSRRVRMGPWDTLDPPPIVVVGGECGF